MHETIMKNILNLPLFKFITLKSDHIQINVFNCFHTQLNLKYALTDLFSSLARHSPLAVLPGS